jgi:hypothetical protein
VKDALKMRGRSKPECNVWTVLNRHSIVVGKEFVFHAGIPLLPCSPSSTPPLARMAPSRSLTNWRKFSTGGRPGSLPLAACWFGRDISRSCDRLVASGRGCTVGRR